MVYYLRPTIVSLLLLWQVCGAWALEPAQPAKVGVSLQARAVAKGDCIDVYVGGLVAEVDQVTPIEGVFVNATYLSDDHIGDIFYYDHQSFNGSQVPWTPNGLTESRSRTGTDGVIHLRVDVCPNELFWEVNFNICVNKEGYQSECLAIQFNQSDDQENRFFYLEPATPSTPTPSPTPTATATPTVTQTLAGVPTAVHPELDVDHNGIIGPGDLILLLQDWLRPVH